MLGLLEMDVDECIAAYTKLIREVFSEKLHRSPVGITGKIQARFDSKKLQDAIEAVLVNKDVPVTTRLNNGTERGCRVFVCAASKETGSIARLRSYSLPTKKDTSATICEAALATSAATGLFDPVSIGPRKYVDGALGANNPVDQVEDEASNLWCSESGNLKPLVKCFISLGTGNPGKKSIQDRLDKFVSDTLIAISTDTEATAEKFIGRWRQHYDSNQYFRFNVEQGLQQVGVAEYEQQGLIEAATEEYLEGQAQTFRVRDCVVNLKEKQKYADDMLEKVYTTWHNTKTSTARFALCFKLPEEVNSVSHFVARHEELGRLYEELKWTGDRRTVILHGLGGMGKTQTTIAFAKKHRDDYSAVLWLDARDTTTLKQSYQSLAQRLATETSSVTYIENALSNPDLDETVSAVKRWLDEPKNNRWLMIYDNYDDVKLHNRGSPSENETGSQVGIESDAGETGSKAYDIRPYFPETDHGAILVTTRSSSVKLGQRVQLGKLADLEDSLAILASISGRTDLSKDPDAAVLAKKLDGLPLALATAGAYLDQVATSCAEYLEMLEGVRSCVILYMGCLTPAYPATESACF
ncbi:Calcium-independent phospholipase A2-gamma [Colletotrichum fructicola]|nr:Calcium-independent phospholipase A2-gamma [Colletotrichum fructicola]